MSDLSATTIETTSDYSTPKVTVRINGEIVNIIAGGNGQDGDLMLFAGSVAGNNLHDPSQANIHIDGKSSTVRLGGTTGSAGSLSVEGGAPFGVSKIELGGNGGAQIKLTPSPSNALSTTSVHLDGETGSINLRPVISASDNTVTKGGNLTVFDTLGTGRVQLDGQNGDVTLRGRVANDGTETGANLKLFDGKNTLRI